MVSQPPPPPRSWAQSSDILSLQSFPLVSPEVVTKFKKKFGKIKKIKLGKLKKKKKREIKKEKCKKIGEISKISEKGKLNKIRLRGEDE